ncbi:MAG: hypothetical protein R3302_02620 [Sulfurimonadaceae bacterium]|nr:hypothetical protein [Sulfurimonadaceae bacterium]
MSRLIDDLKTALQSIESIGTRDFASALAIQYGKGQSETVLKRSYPISVIHDGRRLKVPSHAELLLEKGMLDSEGLTPEEWTGEMLQTYAETGSPIQTVDVAVLKPEQQTLSKRFSTKRPKDFWKRLSEVDDLLAMISIAVTTPERITTDSIEAELSESKNGQWGLESDLRDAMRSKKENGVLRPKPFIWIGIVEDAALADCTHVEALARHYFGNSVVTGSAEEFSFVIGCGESLEAISLREFYKKR